MHFLKPAFIIGVLNFWIVSLIIFFSKTPSPSVPSAPLISPTITAPGCIITIDSQKYDLTNFINLHSGGDVFTCGTDMSADFHQRHPQSYLQTLSKYKI